MGAVYSAVTKSRQPPTPLGQSTSIDVATFEEFGGIAVVKPPRCRR
jgi:hypothetical protein